MLSEKTIRPGKVGLFLLSRAAFVPFGLCLPAGSGYRVVTAASPRMAPCEPPERQPQPLQRPVFTQCFEGILRAGRREAARRRRERGDAELVELHQRDQRQGADAFKGVPRLFRRPPHTPTYMCIPPH